jgi:hypothetical protein
MPDEVSRISVHLSAKVHAQIAEALADGSALGRLISRKLDVHAAHLIVPSGLRVPVPVALENLTRGGLTRQQMPTSMVTQWLANRITEYLHQTRDACCVIENRYAREGDASLGRFKQPASVLRGGGLVHILMGVVSTDVVLDTLKKASSLPHAAVFWTRRLPSTTGQVDETDLADTCERVFLFVCDGEAYLELGVTN